MEIRSSDLLGPRQLQKTILLVGLALFYAAGTRFWTQFGNSWTSSLGLGRRSLCSLKRTSRFRHRICSFIWEETVKGVFTTKDRPSSRLGRLMRRLAALISKSSRYSSRTPEASARTAKDNNLAFTMRTNPPTVLRKRPVLQARLYLYRLVILGSEASSKTIQYPFA